MAMTNMTYDETSPRIRMLNSPARFGGKHSQIKFARWSWREGEALLDTLLRKRNDGGQEIKRYGTLTPGYTSDKEE